MLTFDPFEFSSTFSTSAPAVLLALRVRPLAPGYHHDDYDDGDDDDVANDDVGDEKGGFTSLFPLAQRGQQVSAARS